MNSSDNLVFSYWIYVWYLLYAFKFTIYSPKLALSIGLFDNIIMLFLMIIFGTGKKTIFLFLVINTFIKVIPLYYLRNEILQIRDLYFTLFLFFVFFIWLYINNQSLTGNIKLIRDSLLYGTNQTPFINLISKIEKNYKNMKII